MTNAIALRKESNVNSRTSLSSTTLQPSGTLGIGRILTYYCRLMAPTTLRNSRKARATGSTELLCEVVFRPLAHLVVLALLPLRVPPPAVVFAGMGTGLAAAAEIGRGDYIGAALLLQLKTVLDNADGQLARAAGRVSVFGRYLDSESDLLVNAAIFVALGDVTGRWWLTAASFAALTLVLSVDFNLERLFRRERGEEREARPAAPGGAAAALGRVYDLVYAPQDRLVERLVETRLRKLGAGPEERLRYHDDATLTVVANFGLSTQLAALGVCLLAGRPEAYLWVPIACALALVPLELRRRYRVRG
jgi:archaetidylinositol phosphate synthase